MSEALKFTAFPLHGHELPTKYDEVLSPKFNSTNRDKNTSLFN